MSIEIDTYQNDQDASTAAVVESVVAESINEPPATISPAAVVVVDQLTSSSTSAAVSSSSSSSSSSNSEPEDSNSYDTVFPSLPSSVGAGGAAGSQSNSCLNFSSAASDATANKAHRRLNTTTVFQVPLAERKDLKSGFGGSDNSTSRKCEEIAKKHMVKVEMCSAKDQSLHIVISGAEERVHEAKRQMVAELQTERDFKVSFFFNLFL
jgi:hypothetical protein